MLGSHLDIGLFKQEAILFMNLTSASIEGVKCFGLYVVSQ